MCVQSLRFSLSSVSYRVGRIYSYLSENKKTLTACVRTVHGGLHSFRTFTRIHKIREKREIPTDRKHSRWYKNDMLIRADHSLQLLVNILVSLAPTMSYLSVGFAGLPTFFLLNMIFNEGGYSKIKCQNYDVVPKYF